MRRNQTIWHLSTIVVFKNLFVGDRGDTVIVKFVPPSVLGRFDEGKVMTTVEITRVNKHTVKFVHMGCVGVALVLIDEFCQVDREGEFVAVVDLDVRLEMWYAVTAAHLD